MSERYNRAAEIARAGITERYVDAVGFQKRIAELEAELSRLQSLSDQNRLTGGWRDIGDVTDCLPVIVGRATDQRMFYRPASAFRDVTGVWRVLFSEGGSTPLPYEPTHWQPLPSPPLPLPGGEEKR